MKDLETDLTDTANSTKTDSTKVDLTKADSPKDSENENLAPKNPSPASSVSFASPKFQKMPSPEDKRKNLIHAAGKPQIGRRTAPEPVGLKERNKAVILGLVLGFIIVVIAFVLFMALGSMNQF